MPVSKKPRKRHQRLAYRIDPMAMLRDHSTEAMRPDQVRDLIITGHSALMAIEKGAGRELDMIQLAVASNIVLVLAEHGMGPEYVPEVKEAQRHIVGLEKRLQAGESLVLTGPGILAVRRMLELHDAQLEHPGCTEGNMRKALRVIHSRMLAGHVEMPA